MQDDVLCLSTLRREIPLKSAAILSAALAAAAVPTAAEAGEVFGGVYVHDVKLPTDLSGFETGADLMLGYRGKRIAHLWKAELAPYGFVAINTAGNTNYGAIGLDAKFPLGRQLYFRPGLGIALHTGSAGHFYRTDKIAFGSRVLFEPELALGAQVSKRVSIEASWVHMSHAQLRGRENPGIDNLGVRLNFAL
jgi:hypothetical protein